MNRTYRATITIYGTVLLAIAAAALTTKVLSLAFGFAPVILFVAAVTFSTVWGGFRAGLVSLLGTVIVINFLFIPPLHMLTLAADDAARLAVFGLAVGIGILLRQKQEAQHKD